MNKKKKKFDCVKMMRDIRKKLHEKYEKNPELREIELERIRKEYGFNSEKIL